MKWLLPVAILATALMPAIAGAECSITGEITAAPNDGDPSMGAWCYTLTVTWDTGDQYALSHLGLIIDTPGGTCLCSDVAAALNFPAVAGSSDGYPGGCTVDYEAFLECDGDPSIPGDEGILIKWEPLEMADGCEPGPTGTGTFTFCSDLGPVPVDEWLPLLIEKNAGEFCEGGITGVFPGLACDPVAAEGATWSEIKGYYSR